MSAWGTWRGDISNKVSLHIPLKHNPPDKKPCHHKKKKMMQDAASKWGGIFTSSLTLEWKNTFYHLCTWNVTKSSPGIFQFLIQAFNLQTWRTNRRSSGTKFTPSAESLTEALLHLWESLLLRVRWKGTTWLVTLRAALPLRSDLPQVHFNLFQLTTEWLLRLEDICSFRAKIMIMSRETD